MALKQTIIFICKIANAILAAIGTTNHVHDFVETSPHPKVLFGKHKNKNRNKQKLAHSSRDPPQNSDPFAPFAPAVADVIIAQGRPVNPKQSVEYRIPVCDFSDIASSISESIVSSSTPLDFDEQRPDILGIALPGFFKMPKPQIGFWKPAEPFDEQAASPISSHWAAWVKSSTFSFLQVYEPNSSILGIAEPPSIDIPKPEIGFW